MGFWHEWLSDSARSEFIRVLPRQQRFARWVDQLRESLRTRRAFITTVFVVIVLHLVVPLFPPVWPGLPTLSEIRTFLSTLWPVHAAIVSAIFIVVFFIIGAIHRGHPLEVILSNVVRKMYLVPVAAFTLSSILGEGISNLLLLEKSVAVGFVFKGLENLLILDSSLFFLTMIALLYCLWLTLKYIRSSEIWSLQNEVAQQLAKIAVEQQIIIEKAEQIRREVVKEAGLSSLGSPGNFKPLRTTKRGSVVDIDLRKVKEFSKSLSLKFKPTDMLGDPVYGSFSAVLGEKIDAERCIIAYVPQEADSPLLTKVIDQALKVRVGQTSALDEFNHAFTEVFERAREAIKSGQRSALKESLDFYREALISFLNSTQSHGITHDYFTGNLKIQIYREWKVRERITRDISELLLQSMSIGDVASYDLMKYYPLELIQIGMEHNDHVIFIEAVRCYTKIYHLIDTIELGRERAQWQDLKRIWKERLGIMLDDMHNDGRRIGNNPQKVTSVVRFAQLFIREIFVCMMLAADRQDKDMCRILLDIFSETWNSFWYIRKQKFSDMEKKAKDNYDKERSIGIVALCGMFALIHHKHGGWESIVEDCVEILLHEFESMPGRLTFVKVINLGTVLGANRQDPQWLWDSLSYINIPSYEENHEWSWIHFDDLVAFGSVMAFVKLVVKKKLTEEGFVNSLNEPAIRPFQSVLRQIISNGDRWKEYLGSKGLEIARVTLGEIEHRSE